MNIIVNASDIPRLINKLFEIQKIVEKNQEIMVQLEGHPDFEGLLDILIDTSLSLSSYRKIVPSKVNPQIMEPLFIEEDSTGKFIETKKVFSKNGKSQYTEKSSVSVFNYDKTEDGTVNLVKQEFELPEVRVNHELYKWFMKVAETAVQLRNGLGIYSKLLVDKQSRVPLPKGIRPKSKISSLAQSKKKRKVDQSIKAYHLRKKGKSPPKKGKIFPK